MRKCTMGLAALVLAVLLAAPVFAHCEIPCGIYDDEMRIAMIAEHIDTIEKSMKQIVGLSQSEGKSPNQLVRWVMNKEEHAKALQEIVTQYFMTQRVKTVSGDDRAAHRKYRNKLELLHRMLVHAMKAKQTTDLRQVEKLRDLLKKFRAVYFGEHGPRH